jgi:hypothetical protein
VAAPESAESASDTARQWWQDTDRSLTAVGLLLCAVAFGVAAWQRIAYFVVDRGFWRDEIIVVLSLDKFGYHDLGGRLLGAQSAPLLWLWSEKFLLGVSHDNPSLARLPALVSALLAVVAVMLLARAAGLAWWACALTIAPICVAPLVVFYSSMVKPYTWDMLAVSVLMLIAVQVHRVARSPRSLRWSVALVAAAVILPWASAGVLLAGLPIVALVAVEHVGTDPGGWRRGLRTSWRWPVALLVVAASTAAAAWQSHATTAGNDNLSKGWLPYYSPLVTPVPTTPSSLLHWAIWVPVDLVRRTSYGPHPAWLLLVIGIGAVILIVRRPFIGVLLVLPALTCYLASAIGIYPMAQRLAFFTLPGLMVAFAAVPDALGSLLVKALRHRATSVPLVGSVVAVLMSLVVIAAGTGQLWSPPRVLQPTLRYVMGPVDYRPAFRDLLARRGPDDVVLIHIGDRPAALFYGLRYHVPLNRFVVWTTTDHPGDLPMTAGCKLPDRLDEGTSVWSMSADRPLVSGRMPRQWILPELQQSYRVTYQQDRSAVTLVQLKKAPRSDRIAATCLATVDINLPGDDAVPWWPVPEA